MAVQSGSAGEDGQEAEARYPDDAPVSLEDLQRCIETLRRLKGPRKGSDDGFAFYDGPCCRELRKAIAPFAARMQRKMFNGASRSEFEEKKAVRRELEARVHQRRALDKQHVQKTAIRHGRLERLAELQRQGEHLPLVADGTVEVSEGPKQESSAPPELSNPRACYICKKRFNLLHHFYSDLCSECASLNWQKRNQACDCHGKVALVTGGRVKIGFQVVSRLLRWGAHVIVTTRFPRDCAQRLAAQAELEGTQWADRLDIYGLDFRDLASLEGFCAFCIQHYPRLDILINNACQTVRRPAGFYRHLMDGEASERSLSSGQHRMLEQFDGWRTSQPEMGVPCLAALPAAAAALPAMTDLPAAHLGVARSAALSQVDLLPEDTSTQFPKGVLDTNGQQVDLRLRNTWVMKLDEIETAELAEVFLINAMAPFILNSRLQRLMECGDGEPKVVVNVSAMEGKFYRTKAPYHPHTNMAKSALNQLTRTAAGDLAKKQIFMCAVDTGWINDENPLEKARRYSEEHQFQCPLDEIDAAARILDPVVVALSGGEPLFDVFLKDYNPTEW